MRHDGCCAARAAQAEPVGIYRQIRPQRRRRPRPDIGPVRVVTAEEGKRELVPMRWGLIPRWWSKTIKDAKMATFNARAETVETKPFFRDAFKRTRYLIPMSGYYEWQDTPGGKQPWYFTGRDGSPLLTVPAFGTSGKIAGPVSGLKSCTMIITEPNHFAAEVHDRMPVFLSEQQFARRGGAGRQVSSI
jgi:putative SOS response-associated peptidase YedK